MGDGLWLQPVLGRGAGHRLVEEQRHEATEAVHAHLNRAERLGAGIRDELTAGRRGQALEEAIAVRVHLQTVLVHVAQFHIEPRPPAGPHRNGRIGQMAQPAGFGRHQAQVERTLVRPRQLGHVDARSRRGQKSEMAVARVGVLQGEELAKGNLTQNIPAPGGHAQLPALGIGQAQDSPALARRRRR